MNVFLVFAFLFFIGSTFGWVLELFYRRFFSRNNPDRKWINPGFCTGPYLPLYGTGLCFLFMIASVQRYINFGNYYVNIAFLLVSMAAAMTVIEYIAGIMMLKNSHIRLWDYSREWANIQGVICPKFSFYWGILGAVYYFFIHPYIIDALYWLAENLAFSFVIGMFLGVFIIDAVNSTQLIAKLKKLSDEYEVVVRYEEFKSHIRSFQNKQKSKYNFFRPLYSELSLSEHIRDLKQSFEKIGDIVKK